MGTDWPTVAVRLLLYAALGVLWGLPAFALMALGADERHRAPPLRRPIVGLALVGIAGSVVALVLTASAMAGTPAWPIDKPAVGALIADPGYGRAWIVRLVALEVALVAAPRTTAGGSSLTLLVSAAGVALATLAWTGHGATGDGAVGWAHLGGDVLHLLAAGAWLGALLGLILLVGRPSRIADAGDVALAGRALSGFAATGTLLVGVLVVTGIGNAWLLVGPGHIRDLAASAYGRLLLAKLALFAAMLGCAALNRWLLTPLLRRAAAMEAGRALRLLRRSIGIEAGLALAVLAAVAWMGTLEPPTSM